MPGWQLTQGKVALGTGGWWGVGLGGSREKWGALPEAHTDFIFPIIGEELGLLGALTVLGLFAAHDRSSPCGWRSGPWTSSSGSRASASSCWIIGQALVNLGAVLQLLPITGRAAAVRLLRRVVAAAVADGGRGAARRSPSRRQPHALPAERRLPSSAADSRAAAGRVRGDVGGARSGRPPRVRR